MKTSTALLMVAATLTFGCTAEYELAATTASSETPPVAAYQENPPTPYRYGDDPYYDALWDSCEADDIDACEDLYWESPKGSEYKRFGDERLDVLLDVVNEQSILDLIGPDFLFEIIWDDMTQDEQNSLCLSLAIFGPEETGDIIAESSGGLVSAESASLWLTKECQ
jgi:hypothetical protein